MALILHLLTFFSEPLSEPRVLSANGCSPVCDPLPPIHPHGDFSSNVIASHFPQRGGIPLRRLPWYIGATLFSTDAQPYPTRHSFPPQPVISYPCVRSLIAFRIRQSISSGFHPFDWSTGGFRLSAIPFPLVSPSSYRVPRRVSTSSLVIFLSEYYLPLHGLELSRF